MVIASLFAPHCQSAAKPFDWTQTPSAHCSLLTPLVAAHLAFISSASLGPWLMKWIFFGVLGSMKGRTACSMVHSHNPLNHDYIIMG